MLPETQSFEFGEFTLDAREKTLSCNGKPVSVTPKAIDLLLVLIENNGRLIEKADLMREVWGNTFVEEGNIAFTVGLLRKSLGDSPQNSRFIETLPKRGYRFIHEVKRNTAESGGNARNDLLPNDKRRSHTAPVKIVGTVLIGVALVAFGGWYLQRGETVPEFLNLSSPLVSEKLSTNGRVMHAVISPDGKNVVYANGTGADKQSVWIREIDSGNNVEIIPPSDDIYLGFAFSRGGNVFYFSRVPKNAENQAGIYRTSVFGGVPNKIISKTQGWISVSPDSSKISFVRCYYRAEENCSLWIADAADGKNERKVAARPAPFRISDNQFSLDGKKVAFATGQSQNQSNEFSLMEVDIETGTERKLTSEKFFNIKSLAWLPSGSGLLITASRISVKNYRIWQVSAVSGNVEPLTSDSENYATLSLSQDGNRLVSTRVREEFRLRLLERQTSLASRALADASTAAFAPDGKIYFTSLMSGNEEVWGINSDGSGQRKLTVNSADDARPVVSRDNNSVFFASNRTGAVHVWRMNIDGSDQKQITDKEGGFPIFVSPDNLWVYYHHGITRTLWRTSLLNGEEKVVIDKSKYRFALSPDGKHAAFTEIQGEENLIIIVSLEDGKIVETYVIPNSHLKMPELVWMPDGKALAYILTDGEFKFNTVWMQELNTKPPVKVMELGGDEISESGGFAVAPDGKSFAVVQGGWRHDAILTTGIK